MKNMSKEISILISENEKLKADNKIMLDALDEIACHTNNGYWYDGCHYECDTRDKIIEIARNVLENIGDKK